METLRVLFRKIEGKLNNIFEFSIIDKILRLNKDIKKDIIIKFIGKREKIYTKSTNFTEFNTCLISTYYYIFFIIIAKSPRCYKRFWYDSNLFRIKIPLIKTGDFGK